MTQAMRCEVLTLRRGDVLLVHPGAPMTQAVENLLTTSLEWSLEAQMGFRPTVRILPPGATCQVMRKPPGPLAALRAIWGGLVALGEYLQRSAALRVRATVPRPVTAARVVSDGEEIEFHLEIAGSWWVMFQRRLVADGRARTETVTSDRFLACPKAWGH